MTAPMTYSESTDPDVLTAADAAELLAGAPWRRMITIGDSIAEGVREPHDAYRDLSWTERVEEALASGTPGFTAANLGRRNLLAAEIRATQLNAALEFGPDLAFVIGGGNDMLRPGFDPEAVRDELTAMVSALRATGADVLLLGLFDITRAGLVPPKYADAVRRGTRALAEVTAEVAARHDALFAAFADHPAGDDPGIYASDHLHLNARGHAIAAATTLRTLSARLNR
ncbi:SGNH/GDSL hydrolase family protein [Thermomonospora umbrina]|uniref:Lysophospholipase L1-like esterase n=1 Tax=Thermomonospora umbrina TaxID=111806 RepID=A0A3D9SHJ6_9ACTN|nr:SGNH/GDSL hydrolase family protein [Thermomonospora umbrina]REE95167.1 lysophospholipase L1-like esterase [Thermomonospora umbrina]